MSFRAYLWAVICSTGAILPSPHARADEHPNVQVVQFELRDADSGGILEDGKLEMPDDKTITLTNTSNGRYEASVSADAPADMALSVKATGGVAYYERELTLFMPAYKRSILFTIYLAHRNPGGFLYSQPAITDAQHRMSDSRGGVDRAVALLGRIYDEAKKPGADEFVVRLLYNYADALFRDCVTRFVDLCDKARSVASELGAYRASNPRLLDDMNVKTLPFEQAKFLQYATRMKYLRAKWDFRQSNYSEARAGFADVLAAIQTDPALATGIMVGERRLEADLALCDTKLAQASP